MTENLQPSGPDQSGSKPPPKIPSNDGAEEKKQNDDWWNGFKKAVEDPNTNLYEYLRDKTVENLEIEDEGGFSSYISGARKKAVSELKEFKSPEELSKKLEKLEKNSLLFNAQTRVGIKVMRVLVDTFVDVQKDLDGKGKKKNPTEEEIAESVEKKLESAGVTQAIEDVSKSLQDHDEDEVRETINQAVKQLSEDRSLSQMGKDATRFVFKYFSPDNIVNVAIHALPLITWQYRWALALGLGAFACRKTVSHGFKATIAAIKKTPDGVARKEARKALTALKAAGGNVIVIGLTPAVAKIPKFLSGFVTFLADTTYKSVVENAREMLEDEKKKPGSTPISKQVKKGTKSFLQKNQDKLTSLSTGALNNLVPTTITSAIVEVIKRLPLTKMKKLASRTWGLGTALAIRFNLKATPQPEPKLEAGTLQQEQAAVKKELSEARHEIEDALAVAGGKGRKVLTNKAQESFAASMRGSVTENKDKKTGLPYKDGPAPPTIQ